MKRQAQEPKDHPDVCSTWPVFEWCRCEGCGREFRREWGWRVLTGPFYGGMGRWRYVCGDCAGSGHEAWLVTERARYARMPELPKIPFPRNREVNGI